MGESKGEGEVSELTEYGRQAILRSIEGQILEFKAKGLSVSGEHKLILWQEARIKELEAENARLKALSGDTSKYPLKGATDAFRHSLESYNQYTAQDDITKLSNDAGRQGETD